MQGLIRKIQQSLEQGRPNKTEIGQVAAQIIKQIKNEGVKNSSFDTH